MTTYKGHASYRDYISAVDAALNSVENNIRAYLQTESQNAADLVYGPTGPRGQIGVEGATGPTGVVGITGPSGSDGLQGVSGSNGPTGATGPSGNAGISGTQGATGPRGATGPAGTGAVGVTGAAGATGATGSSSRGVTSTQVGATGANASTTLVLQRTNGFTQFYTSGAPSGFGEIRYKTSTGNGANTWMNQSAQYFIHHIGFLSCIANLDQTKFNNLEALPLLKSNAKAGVNLVSASNVMNANVTYTDTTGTFTLAYPTHPILVQFWLAIPNATNAVNFTLRLRSGTLTGTVLSETTMVQTYATQSVTLYCTAITQGVSVIVPTLYCSGLFTELMDSSQYGIHMHVRVRSN